MLDPDLRPIFADGMALEAAQEQLEAAALGDGLPMVPPTERRLSAMLEGVRHREQCRGIMPPLFGEITAEDVAYQCVLAGCRAGVVPLVLSAATAVLAPEFNLLGVATTTGSAAVAMIVHGPVVDELGLSATTNCLGPGNRANATIGRALALVLRNIGGARPGEGDMATLGQPAKYTLCFAENGDDPIPPLHVRHGLAASTSAVSVLAISGTAEVLPDPERATPQSVLDPLITIMRAANATTGASRQPYLPQQVFVLPSEATRVIVSAGWDVSALQAYVHSHGVTAVPGDVLPITAGGAGIKMAYLPLWGGGSRVVTVAVEARDNRRIGG